MPQMGADMTEGTLLKWLKRVGDSVQRGDILAEIETDKATVELEAYESGTILKQLASEGDVVPVGDVIALLGEPSEAAPEVDRSPLPRHQLAGRSNPKRRSERSPRRRQRPRPLKPMPAGASASHRSRGGWHATQASTSPH